MTFLVTVANGCVTQKRCNEKFPPSVSLETIIRDTVIITNPTHFDTIFRFSEKDTVYLRDTKTQIKVKVVRVRDSVWVHSECPPDTVRIEKVRIETTVERVRHILSDNPWRMLWIVLGIIGIMFSFGYLIRAIKK
jgi:hypothetical protein